MRSRTRGSRWGSKPVEGLEVDSLVRQASLSMDVDCRDLATRLHGAEWAAVCSQRFSQMKVSPRNILRMKIIVAHAKKPSFRDLGVLILAPLHISTSYHF